MKKLHEQLIYALVLSRQDFPGLDSLHKYEVSVEDGGEVRVKAKRSVADKGGDRLKDCPGSEKVPTGSQTVVIVGGGPAAQTCAETLRNRCG